MFLFINHTTTAQLYSSGNNVISGTKVGIGTNVPTSTLSVKAAPLIQRQESPLKIEYFKYVPPSQGLPELSFHLPAIFVKHDGKVGIHTESPTENFHINSNTLIQGDVTIKGNNSATIGNTEVKITSQGYIRARDVLVDFEEIPDYVFSKTYKLMPLLELKKYIEINSHLPNIKSANEFESNGNLSVSEMNIKLLEKVEELTLYIIQLEERISQLEN